MSQLAGEAAARPRGPGAAFVAMRFGGGLAALAGAMMLGLLLAEEPCLPTAGEEARWAWGAGACTAVGLVIAIGAWRPRPALQLAATLLLLALVAGPFVSGAADRAERGRAMRTMGSMRVVAAALDFHQRRTGRWPAAWHRFDDVAAMLEREPGWSRPVPRTDAWGGAFIHQRAGEGYALIASCRCGLLDAPNWSDYDHGRVADPRSDLMILSGSRFVRHPPGGAAPTRPATSPPPR